LSAAGIIIPIGNVILAFAAGVFFTRWMSERRRRQRNAQSRAWYREVR